MLVEKYISLVKPLLYVFFLCFSVASYGAPESVWVYSKKGEARYRKVQNLSLNNHGDIIVINDYQMTALSQDGKFKREINIASDDAYVSSVSDIGNNRLVITYYTDVDRSTRQRGKNKVVIVNTDSFVVEKEIELPLRTADIQYAKTNNFHYFLGSLRSPERLILMKYDHDFNYLSKVSNNDWDTDHAVNSLVANLGADSDNNLILFASAEAGASKGYIDSIIKLNADMALLWDRQRVRKHTENTASGYRYHSMRETISGDYLVLAATSNGMRKFSQFVFGLDKKNHLLWKKNLPNSARYGNKLKRTNDNTYLVSSESGDGKAYLCEITEKGDVVFEYTYRDAPGGFTPAYSALKVGTDYILAVRSEKDFHIVRVNQSYK